MPLMISGAKYSYVPQKVYALVLPEVTPSLDNPKSVNLTRPSEPRRMFSGFKSL